MKSNETAKVQTSSQMPASWNDSKDSEAQARFDMEAKHQARIFEQSYWGPTVTWKQSLSGFLLFCQAILRDLEQLRAEKE